jgi:uncharacterized protein
MGVTATASALEAIARLQAERGPVAFFQSGGCCDGSSPICLEDGELPPAAHDLLLGRIGGAPFYIDADQYERWRRPDFVVDPSPGPAEGFSLGPADQHFVTKGPR